jgi:hypothetical protein
MNREHDYVNYFYGKYEGRVAIGVGYDQSLSEIYSFVFEDTDGKSIGVVALGVLRMKILTMPIFTIWALSRPGAEKAAKYFRNFVFRQTNTRSF